MNADVECAAMEAAIMAEVISQWMTRSLGFEKSEPPKLTEDDCTRIHWAITTLADMTRKVDDACNARLEAQANARRRARAS